MSDDRQWLHDQLKANLAETIVAHLLEKSGNKVYQYGWEFKLQNLLRGGDVSKVDRGSKVADVVSSMPDLLVISPNGERDNIALVEVKFRSLPPASPESIH